jgi:phospholipid/cholesterol/gamma-HCH transport system ATP-binding protein
MSAQSPSLNTVPKIKLTGVTKSFGDNHVLKGVDLEIANGESMVLIGASASGKTLLMKGILAPRERETMMLLGEGPFELAGRAI